MHAYRLSGSDPLRLTADERYVADAVSLGDRVLVAVRPGEIFSVDPLDPEATRTVLFRDRVVFDFARVENELFSIGGETWDREAAVARMSPDGTWEPLLLVASERASLRANGRGDLVLVEDHCGLSSLPVLRFRNLPAGAESFGPAIEITCPQSLAALDDDHAYLRAGLDDPDQRFLRHPLAGGEPNRVRGSDTLWSVVGVDETWLYGTRDGAIVRIPK